jgi:hypothetical protein
MEKLRCPNLDALGLKLIEAYRQLGDPEVEVISIPNLTEAGLRLSSLEQEIRNHCQRCAICLAIAWRRENVYTEAKDEPAWLARRQLDNQLNRLV